MSPADEIFAVQAKQNNGRGVSCVRDIVIYLRESGDTDRAKAVVWSEFDKIRNYPEIVAVLRKHGLTHEVDEMHARVDRMCRGDRGE
jgi:hypothetical protein